MTASKSPTIFVRLDKIGDLAATLPVDQAEFLHGEKILWLIDERVQFLADLAEPTRHTLPVKMSSKNRFAIYLEVLRLLQKHKPPKVVIFYAPWWVSLACWWASVPWRVGRRSQWHSWIFLNKSLRQSRSQSDKHEAVYNWELLHFAYGKLDGLKSKAPSTVMELALPPTPLLKIQAPLKRQLFEKYDLRSKSFIVVHPGMAGSALNWPQSRYNELIDKLVVDQTVVITGTASDSPWLTQIAPRWKNHPQVRYLVGELKIEDLIFILQSAHAVIAPSTGVLHLAAATGTPSIGIYSPVLAHHPRRWGPRGIGAKTLLPAVQCPATISCLGSSCSFFPCMGKILSEQVIGCIPEGSPRK